MCSSSSAGQPANATRPYANLRFRRHDPDVEHRQDLAESIRQSYAAEGGPVIVSPADVQRQLADRGLVVGQKKIRRMLADLIADGQLVRQRRGNPYVYEPLVGQQQVLISNARPRSPRGRPPATPPAAPGVTPPAVRHLPRHWTYPPGKTAASNSPMPELLALHLEPCVLSTDMPEYCN